MKWDSEEVSSLRHAEGSRSKERLRLYGGVGGTA